METLTPEERDRLALRTHLLRRDSGLPATSRRTHRFIVLRPHEDGSGGVTLLLAATRRPRDGAKVVASWTPGAPSFHFRDITYKGPLAGWVVDWDIAANDDAAARTGHRPFTCSGYFVHSGWLSTDADCANLWDAARTLGPFGGADDVLNPEALASTRYRYCGWKPGTFAAATLPAILLAYDRNPKTELLVKAGLFHLLGSPGKMRDMERSPALRRYAMRHPDEVRSLPWCDLKWRLAAPAARTLEAALARAAHRRSAREFWSRSSYGLPKKLDRIAAYDYCVKRGILPSAYAEALRLAAEEGLDPRSRSVAFPADFETFLAGRQEAERKRQAAAAERAAQALRERDRNIASFVQTLHARLARLRLGADWKIVWLESQDAFAREGASMGNCIGGGTYSLRMSRRECVCLVLASKGERVDVEIDSEWRVRQCYASRNSTPSPAAARLAERIARTLRRKAG